MSEQEPDTPKAPLLQKLGAIGMVLAGLCLIGGAGAYSWWRSDVRDPFPDYALDLSLRVDAAPLKVGAAKVDITPTIVDSWSDIDGDGVYEPDAGEPFEDRNGNGVFDAVWIAGYGHARPATGVHDPLWARALVIEVGDRRVGLVSVDLVGLFNTDVIRIRQAMAEASPDGSPLLDYIMVAATHNHEGPDTLGLWGPSRFETGVSPAYQEKVIRDVVEALKEATIRLQPARATSHTTAYGGGLVVHDYKRRPDVLDDTLGVIHFIATDDTTIATLVNWSDHPETMGDRQTLITSDFPHWLREGVEKGVGLEGRDPRPGLGGMCIYLNGSVGGMVTSLAMDLPDRETGEMIPQTLADGTRFPWSRAQSVGDHVAAEVLRLVHSSDQEPQPSLPLRVRARRLGIPMNNPVFRLAAKVGVLARGVVADQLLSEVALIDLGATRLVCVPGEIYPEIVIGGIESPEGADFAVEPLEVPPLKEALSGDGIDHVLILGLANDEVGYLIPKSEWDAPDLPWDSDGNPPYLYGADSPPYGEINSCGPDAAKTVYDALIALSKDD